MNLSALQSTTLSLEVLVQKLFASSTQSEKIAILDGSPQVDLFLDKAPLLKKFLHNCSQEGQIVIKSILAIGEGPVIFRQIDNLTDLSNGLQKLVDNLWEVECFYYPIGGIVGYQYIFTKLLLDKAKLEGTLKPPADYLYIKPSGIDIVSPNEEVNQAIKWGLENLPMAAEIYPVGGAGDRLNLIDEESGIPLPVAQLPFRGSSLLNGLIQDLQAREWLFYKLYGKQTITPIIMMTSHEKANHTKIHNICVSNEWFGRPANLFFFIIQPLVPVITEEGHWVMDDILKVSLKPGGHGVIWKLAHDQGVFKWLAKLQRNKALVRQINNPVAGTDYGLLALYGIGSHENKAFGFASCPRQLHTAEGVNVLIECKEPAGYEYCISNIEYTDFSQKGIQDIPDKPGSNYSRFPANTNILFADLKILEKLVGKCPIPGMLINLKHQNPQKSKENCVRNIKAGRVESTMQNISDCILDRYPHRLAPREHSKLSTFLIYNKRKKTISVTKRFYEPNKPLIETPPGCFFELLQNHQELLKNYCNFDVPEMCSEKIYLEEGPSFIFLFHPALGPLYTIIGKKLHGGTLAKGAEMQLDIAEIDIKNLFLDGSLIVRADSPFGIKNPEGTIHYSEQCGKCELLNVEVRNKGIDRKAHNIYWKNQINRHEKMKIVLHGDAEFFAENITFKGNCEIEVPNGFRCV
ncbi:MAG TPA: hypothetical protein VIH61_02825, partial [Waddliaceae bacterium]